MTIIPERTAGEAVSDRQSGERSMSLGAARRRGLAAVDRLGLTAELVPVSAMDPGVSSCILRRHGRPVLAGVGHGKGSPETAEVGAIFEALEHFLSAPEGFTAEMLHLRPRDSFAGGVLAADPAVALLAEVEGDSLACMTARSVQTGADVSVPVFLSVPDYVLDGGTPLREELGDTFDYRKVARYSSNSGWAAGTGPEEAAVHALNELIERDALSLLLIEQFLTGDPRPLRVVDPATLPADLTVLRQRAQDITGAPVHLIDMTTELDVPSFLAFSPPEPGTPARIRGCGTSLSRGHAIRRSLTELVQLHLMMAHASDSDRAENDRLPDLTTAHPELRRCRYADFGPRLAAAEPVGFTGTEPPASPGEHLTRLADILTARGFEVFRRDHHVADGLAVTNVLVPGLERFLLVTDGQLVLPGPRGRAVRKHGRPQP